MRVPALSTLTAPFRSRALSRLGRLLGTSMLLAFMFGAQVELRPADAAPQVFVRPLGSDICNGTLNVDFAGSTGGNCAFQTIQIGILNVDPGGTVEVAPGTYPESLTVANKRLALDGAGSGADPATATIVDPPATGTGIAISTGGTSATDRLTVKDLRVTGAGDGIQTQGNTSFLTFNNVASVGNTGNGISGETGDLQDVDVLNSDLSSNGNTGFRIATAVGTFNGLEITGGQMIDNGEAGLSTGPSGSVGVTNVTVDGTVFRRNGFVGAPGNPVRGNDISLFGFNGNVSLSNLVIEADARTSVQIRGIGTGGTLGPLGPLGPSGTIVLNNVTISGAPKFGLYFQDFTTLNATLTGVSIATTSRTDGTAFGLVFDNVGGAVNIGNTSLAGDTSRLIALFEQAQVSVNATAATFVGLTDPFAIEDRIFHALDAANTGLVTFIANNVYVSSNTFSGTVTPSIQGSPHERGKIVR